VLAEYAQHYNGHRPHQGWNRNLRSVSPARLSISPPGLRAGRFWAGLISEYYRAA